MAGLVISNNGLHGKVYDHVEEVPDFDEMEKHNKALNTAIAWYILDQDSLVTQLGFPQEMRKKMQPLLQNGLGYVLPNGGTLDGYKWQAYRHVSHLMKSKNWAPLKVYVETVKRLASQ